VEKNAYDAKLYARNVGITRATIADPDYIQKKADEVASSSDLITMKVIRGQGLLDLKMNLHHAVGRAA
jgi:leucyl aminopeptidase